MNQAKLAKKTVRQSIAFMVACLSFSNPALALSEKIVGAHDTATILQIISQASDIDQLRAQLSQTGVPALDSLWNSRIDYLNGVPGDQINTPCDSSAGECRVFSKYNGQVSNRPVVLLPGFTGYRKMFTEEIYDLIQDGYGPIYIVDFLGTGDSSRQELKPGQPLKLTADFMSEVSGAQGLIAQPIQKVAGLDSVSSVAQAVSKIPVGIGYIKNFSDYIIDIDKLMAVVNAENPDHKVLMISLSMSGLNLLEALAAQNGSPSVKWIGNVDRIVLQSPMVHVKTTDVLGLPNGATIAQLVTGVGSAFDAKSVMGLNVELPLLVPRALGVYDPTNTISHSTARMEMANTTRAWSGHDTFGATWRWASIEVLHQYSNDPVDLLINRSALNLKIKSIANVLTSNGIPLVIVASEGDALVDTNTTKRVARDLANHGLTQLNLCLFKTAKHEIDLEADLYRDPFMTLLNDQKDHVVQSSYGVAPANEVLNCQQL